MPVVQLRCATCQKTTTLDKAVWDSAAGPGNTQSVPCPYLIGTNRLPCSGMMHKYGRLLVKRRTIESRPSMASVEKQNERGKRKRSVPEHLAIYQAYSAANGDDDEDEDEVSAKRPMMDDPDGEWLLPKEFNPAMRLTKDRMEAPRTVSQSSTGTIKTTGRVRVGNAIDGERTRKPDSCFNAISAWRHARNHAAPNAGRYTLNKKNHYEYCHLQGVALGGTTVHANLVAGHYAVNTCMMAIESRVQAGAFDIEITAYCSLPDIADFINYKVYKAGQIGHCVDINIDGRITKFSEHDLNDLDAELTRNGLPKRRR